MPANNNAADAIGRRKIQIIQQITKLLDAGSSDLEQRLGNIEHSNQDAVFGNLNAAMGLPNNTKVGNISLESLDQFMRQQRDRIRNEKLMEAERIKKAGIVEQIYKAGGNIGGYNPPGGVNNAFFNALRSGQGLPPNFHMMLRMTPLANLNQQLANAKDAKTMRDAQSKAQEEAQIAAAKAQAEADKQAAKAQAEEAKRMAGFREAYAKDLDNGRQYILAAEVRSGARDDLFQAGTRVGDANRMRYSPEEIAKREARKRIQKDADDAAKDLADQIRKETQERRRNLASWLRENNRLVDAAKAQNGEFDVEIARGTRGFDVFSDAAYQVHDARVRERKRIKEERDRAQKEAQLAAAKAQVEAKANEERFIAERRANYANDLERQGKFIEANKVREGDQDDLFRAGSATYDANKSDYYSSKETRARNAEKRQWDKDNGETVQYLQMLVKRMTGVSVSSEQIEKFVKGIQQHVPGMASSLKAIPALGHGMLAAAGTIAVMNIANQAQASSAKTNRELMGMGNMLGATRADDDVRKVFQSSGMTEQAAVNAVTNIRRKQAEFRAGTSTSIFDDFAKADTGIVVDDAMTNDSKSYMSGLARQYKAANEQQRQNARLAMMQMGFGDEFLAAIENWEGYADGGANLVGTQVLGDKKALYETRRKQRELATKDMQYDALTRKQFEKGGVVGTLSGATLKYVAKPIDVFTQGATGYINDPLSKHYQDGSLSAAIEEGIGNNNTVSPSEMRDAARSVDMSTSSSTQSNVTNNEGDIHIVNNFNGIEGVEGAKDALSESTRDAAEKLHSAKAGNARIGARVVN